MRARSGTAQAVVEAPGGAAAAVICLYSGNNGLVIGTSLRILLIGPLAFTCPLANPTAKLYSPRQYLCAMSAGIVILTSALSSLPPSITSYGSANLTVN